MTNDELKKIMEIATETIDESITDGIDAAVQSIKVIKGMVEKNKSELPPEYYHGVMDTFNCIINGLEIAIKKNRKLP